MMKRFLILTAVLAPLCVGCAIGNTEDRGDADPKAFQGKTIDNDASMENALGLIFGMPLIDDRLDYDAGDREDWRYIIVPEDGKMSIIINLDNPQMLGGWNIYDSQGRTLHSQSFTPSKSYYEFKDYPVQAGIYYFKIYSTGSSSIYTIGTSFSPNPPEATPPEPVPAPEPEETTHSRHSSSSHEKSSSESHISRSSSRGTRTVTGNVSLFTPQGNDTYNVKLRGVGSEYGIKPGDIGTIEGTKIQVKILRCLATSCQAVVGDGADERILKRAKVNFSVKD